MKKAEMFVEFRPSFAKEDCVLKLSKCLEISRMEASAYIHALVSLGLSYGDATTPDGGINFDTCDIGFIKDTAVEHYLQWDGEDYDLISALVDTGILIQESDESILICPDVWRKLSKRPLEKRKSNKEAQQKRRDKDKKE